MVKMFFRGVVIVTIVMMGVCFAQEEGPSKQVGIKGAPGMGLTVEPGEIVIQNVVPGEPFDLYEKAGITLNIHNRSDSARTFKVLVGKPADFNMPVRKGYTEIPDAAWVKTDTASIRIAPQSKAYIKMTIDVPEKDEYFNQKWGVALRIQGVPEPGEKLALAAAPVYYIETGPGNGLTEKPAGVIGLDPAVVSLEKVSPGKNKNAAAVKVYNNDEKTHTYKIYSYLPPEDELGISMSPGYNFVPDKGWISPSVRKVRIASGGDKEITIDINTLTDEQYSGKSLEGLVMIESDDGSVNFLRVQFETE